LFLYFGYLLILQGLSLLFIGFITGLTLDYFKLTPGLHTAACVLIAYIRPFIINVLISKEVTELTFHEPSPRGMGWTQYMIYAFNLNTAPSYLSCFSGVAAIWFFS
jgi:hypothetical protein